MQLPDFGLHMSEMNSKKYNLDHYSFIYLQEIIPGSGKIRSLFHETILKIQENPMFLRNVMWTDQSKFSNISYNNRL